MVKLDGAFLAKIISLVATLILFEAGLAVPILAVSLDPFKEAYHTIVALI